MQHDLVYETVFAFLYLIPFNQNNDQFNNRIALESPVFRESQKSKTSTGIPPE